MKTDELIKSITGNEDRNRGEGRRAAKNLQITTKITGPMEKALIQNKWFLNLHSSNWGIMH